MGGSIPGAVGFSYARTQSPAPSNGKYAKKTMASAQNGQEMKYYQEGLDFKPKTISKNGGWLDSYDVAQTGTQVKYGTPEYEEAYNRGEVITDEGVRSPILLDEVIVNKKSPAPGFWKQSRDAYLKEHQDDGILSAIGSVVTYPLGLAQQAMMYGLTDKVQRPSEVIGFENNERWFANPSSFGKNLSNLALDVVTDPVNWIGLGELSTVGRLSKAEALAKVAASTEEGLLSKFKPNQNYTLPEIPSELNLNVNQRGLNLERTTPKSSKKLLPQWTERQLDNGLIEQTPLRKEINKEVVKQVVVPGKGEIALKTTLDASGSPVYYFSANVAEGGLSAGKAFKHLEQFIPKGSKILEQKSLSTDSFYNLMQRAKNPKKFTWVDEGQFLPLNNAGKNKMFSNSDKILPGATNVKFEDYNQAVKALNEFNSRITIEGMPKAKLSKIVDDFQPVKDGPWIKKTTFGIDVPNIGLIKEYKQGGVIKDDMGQWAHPGEITEIGSNDITMEGVPYDVLGISDTGDTKLMKPGKNYKFKGKKVTEYPMAQGGKKIKIKDDREQTIKTKESTFVPIIKEIKKPAKVNSQIQKEIKFMKDWTNSPMYNTMLNNSTRGVADEQDIKNIRKERLNDLSIEVSNTPFFFDDDTGGSSQVATGDIKFYPTAYSDSDVFKGTPAHEISHTQDSMRNPFRNLSNTLFGTNFRTSYIPQSDINMMDKYSKSGATYDLLFNKRKDDDEWDGTRDFFKYVTTPTETRARLNSLRYIAKENNIYDPYTQKINMDQLEKLRQRSEKLGKQKGFDPYMQLNTNGGYNDEEILNMLNTISQNKQPNKTPNIAVAKNGLRQEQKGLQNLDNLTNFTNYNKPQPGGWLNKYN
jgi:hypothetical protein